MIKRLFSLLLFLFIAPIFAGGDHYGRLVEDLDKIYQESDKTQDSHSDNQAHSMNYTTHQSDDFSSDQSVSDFSDNRESAEDKKPKLISNDHDHDHDKVKETEKSNSQMVDHSAYQATYFEEIRSNLLIQDQDEQEYVPLLGDYKSNNNPQDPDKAGQIDSYDQTNSYDIEHDIESIDESDFSQPENLKKPNSFRWPIDNQIATFSNDKKELSAEKSSNSYDLDESDFFQPEDLAKSNSFEQPIYNRIATSNDQFDEEKTSASIKEEKSGLIDDSFLSKKKTVLLDSDSNESTDNQFLQGLGKNLGIGVSVFEDYFSFALQSKPTIDSQNGVVLSVGYTSASKDARSDLQSTTAPTKLLGQLEYTYLFANAKMNLFSFCQKICFKPYLSLSLGHLNEDIIFSKNQLSSNQTPSDAQLDALDKRISDERKEFQVLFGGGIRASLLDSNLDFGVGLTKIPEFTSAGKTYIGFSNDAGALASTGLNDHLGKTAVKDEFFDKVQLSLNLAYTF